MCGATADESGYPSPSARPNPATFYGIGPNGYTDYPVLADAIAA
jgi:hypothetical protein